MLPPHGHSSSALIELPGPCSLFIILSGSVSVGLPHLLLEVGTNPEGFSLPRKKGFFRGIHGTFVGKAYGEMVLISLPIKAGHTFAPFI